MTHSLQAQKMERQRISKLAFSGSILASLVLGMAPKLPATAAVALNTSSTPTTGSSFLLAQTAVTVSFQGITSGANVQGKIYVTAQVSQTPSKVDFYIDNNLVGTEQAAPYTLGGDVNGVLNGYDTSSLASGSHTLKAVATVNGVAYSSSIPFTTGTVTTTPAATVTLSGVTSGATVTGKLQVEAKVSQVPSSVKFYVDNVLIHTELYAPYTIMGETNGVPNGYDTTSLSTGNHTVKAVAVVGGVRYSSTTITFSKGATTTPTPTPTPTGFPTSRDKYIWPFAANSIWNKPIGSGAVYKPAGIGAASWFGIDEEMFYKLNSSDPMRPVYAPGAWDLRCSGTNSQNVSLPLPDSLIVPDASPGNTPNNASAFFLPDGKTVVQLSPLARCNWGGPVYGWRSPDVDVYGAGINGGHAGSGLSSLGGSIRKGELIGTDPIRHALKVVIWAKKYLNYNSSSSTKGYRWPADRADAYASGNYGGTNPSLVQGSLLAIPPSVTDTSLGLQTPAGKKLLQALKDYGAYVVDDSYWDAHYFAAEQGVPDEFRQKYGYDLSGVTSGALYSDINKLFQAMQVVDNNSSTNIGGGGTPRTPLAPAFSN